MDKRKQIEAWIVEPASAYEADERIFEIFLFAEWAMNFDEIPLRVSCAAAERLISAMAICTQLKEHVAARGMAARWAAQAFVSLIEAHEREATPADNLQL